LNFEERTEVRLNDHADRLRQLETSDARQTVLIEELCKKLDSLTNWIKALVVTIISALLATGVGFIIWYIQSLPR
jgi:hypothetical protein